MQNTIIFAMMMVPIMSQCDIENSQIPAQDTVGIAGDDSSLCEIFNCPYGHVWLTPLDSKLDLS